MKRVFASDLDGTLLGKIDAVYRFADAWSRLEEKERPVLIYNTGRMLRDAQQLIERSVLPEPDYLICGVGTLIYDVREGHVIKEFTQTLYEGWDLPRIEEIARSIAGIERQPERFQNKLKSSWYLHGATTEDLEKIYASLKAARISANVVYSSGRDLDFLPRFANKGNSLDWLCSFLELGDMELVVAGDSGNDAAMMELRGARGILVANAQPELIEATLGFNVVQVDGVCADGVLQGLDYFWPGFVDVNKPVRSVLASGGLNRKKPDLEGLTAEDINYLAVAYEKAVGALKRNITPLGFSACSLEDNTIRGTDVNYRSVWARDGSIAVIGSLGLEDESIRTCQYNTLQTLLDHMSPTGQLPANVRIDSGEPDYSGVGGICSIDSGLWVIIAFHDFIRKTGDISFLRKHISTLQQAMNWLSAHDSNNDALLEIPEAGDWTDLFGRSYNVLIDEVLWYRANICFGRLLELLGDMRRAGDYLRWACMIKSAILQRFWPTTVAAPEVIRTFADMQYSVGDTSYLLAQVTPFNFNWRCDVYGNVLALLFHVLDIERAEIAFRFLWGVGIHDPYPVGNLYPAVNPGDPDWRGYYTVNLLNLPFHYHNGGIWPFIGGQWVRFINQLGHRKLALQQMVKLAQLNQQGIYQEWEFNEWAHGETGRPMGKAFQAWSASEFILAYQELDLGS